MIDLVGLTEKVERYIEMKYGREVVIKMGSYMPIGALIVTQNTNRQIRETRAIGIRHC